MTDDAPILALIAFFKVLPIGLSLTFGARNCGNLMNLENKLKAMINYSIDLVVKFPFFCNGLSENRFGRNCCKKVKFGIFFSQNSLKITTSY